MSGDFGRDDFARLQALEVIVIGVGLISAANFARQQNESTDAVLAKFRDALRSGLFDDRAYGPEDRRLIAHHFDRLFDHMLDMAKRM